jgi:hypothetical protein
MYYVYTLSYPEEMGGAVFYVGKGSGNRLFLHERYVRLKELAKIDPGSTAFRYSENRDETSKKYVPVDGEFHVDLRHLQRVMNALKTALSDFLDPGYFDYSRKKGK